MAYRHNKITDADIQAVKNQKAALERNDKIDEEIGEVFDPNPKINDWEEYIQKVEAKEIPEPAEIAETYISRPDYSFSIDQALDTIDLLFNGYIPSQDAIEFFNVIRLVTGEEPEVPNSLAHYFLVDLVFGNIKRENYPYSKEIRDKIRINRRKIAIIASRNMAKSTVLSTYLPIYLAVKGEMPNFGSVHFVVGFGDSQLGGAKVMAQSVRDICEDSDFCSFYFESMRFTDEECEFIRKGTKKRRYRAFMYKLKGAQSGVRGIRYRNKRPEILIMDDIIKNEAEANSPIIMKKLRSMIFADAENALAGNKGMIIAVNTPFNKKDPIYSAIESGVWTPVCIPICKDIYIDMPKHEFVGAWPEMHPYERIMERYEDAFYGNTLREFNQELMLRISSESERLIPDSMIDWYDRKYLVKHIHNYTLVITTDLIASMQGKGDLAGAALWAISATDDIFLLDLELKHFTIQTQFDMLFRMIRKWSSFGRLLDVGVEIDGQQQVNVFVLKRMMLEKNIWFRFASQKGSKDRTKFGISSKKMGGSKLDRLKNMLLYFEQGKMHFPNELRNTPDMRELLEEIKYTTYKAITASHDDGLDLISQLAAIDYILPMPDISPEEEFTDIDDDIWEAISDSSEQKNSMIF